MHCFYFKLSHDITVSLNKGHNNHECWQKKPDLINKKLSEELRWVFLCLHDSGKNSVLMISICQSNKSQFHVRTTDTENYSFVALHDI